MKDPECAEFLQWCLPRLRYRWPGFRKVRKQVCKRLGRRIAELGLESVIAYRGYLDSHHEEWQILDSLCRITISRFYRDRVVFDALRTLILPFLARRSLADNEKEVRCWSAGCCSGEEPYTLQILWKLCVMPAEDRDIPLRIIASDTDEELLERASKGLFTESSLGALPPELIRQSFEHLGNIYAIMADFRENIEFVNQDIRRELPVGSFHLILCRNLVFTYFDEALQRGVLERISDTLLPGGFFITGIHEPLPQGEVSLKPFSGIPGIYQKTIS